MNASQQFPASAGSLCVLTENNLIYDTELAVLVVLVRIPWDCSQSVNLRACNSQNEINHEELRKFYSN